MKDCTVTEQDLTEFKSYLIHEEKSKVTIEKYLRDVRRFQAFAGSQVVTKELVQAWKESLVEEKYAVRSINSMLASMNSFLGFLGLESCRVKSLKLQRKAYRPVQRELTRTEYLRLVWAAEQKPRLNMVLQAVCGTGIRVSELRYFTVEAVKVGEVTVSCKGKTRTILLPKKLRKRLLAYVRRANIRTGIIFRTRTGQPLDRSNIWAEMKRLCRAARVEATKVFPHNLRKLFAQTFYEMEKDISKLADVLGHSSIDTTRIYIMTSGAEHRRLLERMNLIL